MITEGQGLEAHVGYYIYCPYIKFIFLRFAELDRKLQKFSVVNYF